MMVNRNQKILSNILQEEKLYHDGQIRQQLLKPNGRYEIINLKSLAKGNFLNCIIELILLKNLKHENIFNKKNLNILSDSFDIGVDAGCDEQIFPLKDILIQTKFEPRQIKYLMFQLFSLVNYFHFNGLVARSINPGHLMISVDLNAYFIDFSSMRLQDFPNNNSKDYRMDLNYSAPEISLNHNANIYESDIWSLGCILFELAEAKPLFRVNNSSDYLRSIFKCLGSPEESNDLAFIKNNGTKKWIRAQSPSVTRNGSDWVSDIEADSELLDLMNKCLKFDPRERISAQKALEHPYFNELYDPCEERAVLTKDLGHLNFYDVFQEDKNQNDVIGILVNELRK